MIARDGERVRVHGPVTLAEVVRLREAGLKEIDRDGLVFDLSGVEEADSSALSLLLEWQREAKTRGFRLAYANLPANMRSLADVYGILELIPVAGE